MATLAEKEEKVGDDVIVTGSCKPKDYPKISNNQNGSSKSNNTRANNTHYNKKTHNSS